MRKILFIIMVVTAVVISYQAVAIETKGLSNELSGRVVNVSGESIPYATIVLMSSDSTQVAGTVSTEDGMFHLTTIEGDYVLKISCLGYVEKTQYVKVSANDMLGDITLDESATGIEKVVVKARMVTREADRFVVNVAGSATAIGKDTYEMIGVSPGVRVSDDGIKINGRGGTKVMIGERLLNMSNEDLLAYLRSIPADNLQKIEVIPVAGADYDASSTGGIIKITLKKQRNDGIDGTIGLIARNNFNDHKVLTPSFRINYQKGGLNLYSSFTYDKKVFNSYNDEKANYMDSDNNKKADLHSNTTVQFESDALIFSLGAVYDLKQKHSFGAEFNYNKLSELNNTDGKSEYRALVGSIYQQHDLFDYLQDSGRETMNTTFNYIYKLDTLGSTFKIIGDYSQSTPNADNYYHTVSHNSLTPTVEDNLYKKTLSDNDFTIYSLTAGVDKKFNQKTSLRFGGKFSYNTVFSDMKYYKSPSALPYVWSEDVESTNPPTDYSERIGALYMIYSTSLNDLSFSAGLRGEYTEQKNTNGDVHKEYLDLFPNATLSYMLNKKKNNMLIAQYSRTISRPSFLRLNGNRVQVTEYTYTIGNPNLKPEYTDNVNLTYVLNGKYSFTLAGQFSHDYMIQQMFAQPGTNIKYYQYTNIGKTIYLLGGVFSIPFNITKWLNINTDTELFHIDNDYDTGKANFWYLNVRAQLNVTLPHNFFFEIDGWYESDKQIGNLKQLSKGDMDVALKKRLLGNSMTIAVALDNALDNQLSRIMASGEGFEESYREWSHNPRVRLSMSYNFNAGKKFKSKTVQSDASDQKARM